MLTYPQLDALWKRASSRPGLQQVEQHLIDIWMAAYRSSVRHRSSDIVEVSPGGCSYLRDASRMRGHPLGAGAGYHRGHAIAHTLGGGTDINLVPQRGSLNIGAFRVLENRAVKTPGALYFTYWMYGDCTSQLPVSVQQGLLCPGEAAIMSQFRN